MLEKPSKEYIKRMERLNANLIDLNKLGDLVLDCRAKEGRGNIVHVRIVNHKRGKNYTQSTSYAFIKRSNLYVGEITSIDPDGKANFKKYYIEPDETLDLRNQYDMRKYICFMLSSMFQNNSYMSSGYTVPNQIYYIEDPTELASDITRNSDNLVTAINRISNMPAAELLSVCRYLTLISSNDAVTVPILKAKLQQLAIKDAGNFLLKLKSRDRAILTVIETAMELRLFEMLNDEYVYNGLPLGRNTSEILSTLQANHEKLRFLQSDIDSSDELMRQMKKLDEEDALKGVKGKDITGAFDKEMEAFNEEFNDNNNEFDNESPEERTARIHAEQQQKQLIDNAKGNPGDGIGDAGSGDGELFDD